MATAKTSTKTAPNADDAEKARLDALFAQGNNNADIIKAAGITNGMTQEQIRTRIIIAMGG